MRFPRFNLFPYLVVGLLAGLMLGAANAQTGQQRQLSPLEREFMDIQQHLSQVQQRVLANQPELQAMGESMEALTKQKMTEQGVDVQAMMQLMRSTEERLSAPGLTDAQKREILQEPEIQQAQQQMSQAWEAVMQDPEVVAARNRLEEAVDAAMKKEEPDMDRLLQRLEQIREQLQQQQGGRR